MSDRTMPNTEPNLLDLVTAYRERRPGETSRKAVTAARVWARAHRPDLAAKGFTEDEILRAIPVRGLLAGHPDLETALQQVVTVPIRNLIVVPGSRDERTQHNTANTYSYGTRAAFKFAIDELHWPLLEGEPQRANAEASDSTVQVRSYQDYVDSLADKNLPLRRLQSDDYHYWWPEQWPDEPRVEWERWLAAARTGQGYSKLRETTIISYRKAFGLLFGGFKQMGLVTEQNFTLERFYELLACRCTHPQSKIDGLTLRLPDGSLCQGRAIQDENGLWRLDVNPSEQLDGTPSDSGEQPPATSCPLQQWIELYQRRIQAAYEDDNYVGAHLVGALIIVGTFLKRWFYPNTVEGRTQLARWGGTVPKGAIHALVLASQWGAKRKAWKDEHPDCRPLPLPEDTWAIAQTIRDYAPKIKNRLYRAQALEIATLLAVMAIVPPRRASISAARIGRQYYERGLTAFYQDEKHCWWLYICRADSKNKEAQHLPLDGLISEYLDAWVNKERGLIFQPLEDPRQDEGFMFPSIKTGGRIAPITLGEAVKRWTYRASGGQVCYSIHTFRHGMATAIYEEAVDIAGTVGVRDNAARLAAPQLQHRSVDTTEQYYAKLETKTAARAAQKLIRHRIERRHGPLGRWERRLNGLIDLLELADLDANHVRQALTLQSEPPDFRRIMLGVGVEDEELPVLWRRLYPDAAPYPQAKAIQSSPRLRLVRQQ
ncbi:MAG: hypothetical protein ACUVX1_12925 [Chloroflexota bacterium]